MFAFLRHRARGELAIVVPTLCEAENIRVLLDRIRQSLDPLGFAYEVIVVDDDSRDGIATIVQEIAASTRACAFRCAPESAASAARFSTAGDTRMQNPRAD